MREILTRIEEFEYITTHIFPEDVILNVSFILKLYIVSTERMILEMFCTVGARRGMAFVRLSSGLLQGKAL